MANKSLFKSSGRSKSPKATDFTAVNLAGGRAYKLSDEAALAQLAMTGCFGSTYYADAEYQLTEIKKLVATVSPTVLAKIAVYSRESGFMKDSSAFLLAVLFATDTKLFKQVFPRVCDNGKMLRNFCQIVRSGQTGRKSFGTVGKTAVQNWLNERTDAQLFNDSVGNDPSLSDVIKMVHPKAPSKEREAFYAYLIGKDNAKYNTERLPKVVKDFETFKSSSKDNRLVPEKANFQMYTALDLSDNEWKKLSSYMGWQATRMNLNTMQRHNVFSDPNMVDLVVKKLSNAEEIKRAKVFPYQLLAAYLQTTDVPARVRNALQDALEVATTNVPSIKGKVYIAVDCSGSMSAPVTGARAVASKISCNQVASLIAASFLRTCEDVEVIKFDTAANIISLNARDSVMTNTQKIGTHGGGTDCASPLALLNSRSMKGDTVIILSDNESWCQSAAYNNRATALQNEWIKFKNRNRGAKLVCVDLAANTTTQAATTNTDTLCVGGFSENVFDVIAAFLSTKETTASTSNFWLDKINQEITLQ